VSSRVLASGGRLVFVVVLLAVGRPIFAGDCEAQPAGDVDFLTAICTEADLDRVSIPSMRAPVDLAAKYLVPARDDPALLGPHFQNVGRFPLHQEFLRDVFNAQFGNLSIEEYTALVEQRATRDYYVGVLSRLQTSEGTLYGFNVIVDSGNAELLSQEEVQAVYDRLKACFKLEPLVYIPDNLAERQAAENFPSPGFQIFFDDSPPVDYEPYTRAVGYGRVRLLNQEDLELANARGQVSSQSIFVLDFAPRDIEGVLAGVITGAQQGELAHLSIRTARRGTPNAFVRGAFDVYRAFEGKLVRIEVTATEAKVDEVEPAEAEAFWATNRPTLSVTPKLDTEFAELSSFAEIVAQEANGDEIVPRFGGKASNLARLADFFEGDFAEYKEIGFAIPARYYLEFIRSNRMPSFLDSEREVTYEEYVNELMTDPTFLSDSEVRFKALDDLRDHMRDEGVVDSDLLTRVIARVAEIFGTPTTRRVRFRSSSNVEDSAEFNGAGLYNSTSGCPGDDLDDDDEGPSLCDSTRLDERTVARALKRVWRSLWNFRAHEERSFFSISHEITAMGILVNRTFIDEDSNGVAFTGNPGNVFDRRYVITVQPGEVSVVSPEPGDVAEKDVLVIENGQVAEIIRATRSSLVEPGEVVLSDEQLFELGAVMIHMDESFPVVLSGVPREQVLLDMELKFMPDGELAIKQVRPFLLPELPATTPTFELQIPENLVVCGAFGVAGASRGVQDEYELKSQMRLRGGTIPLPTDGDKFEADLVEELRLGPTQALAESLAPGLFRVTRFNAQGVARYRFNFSQSFVLPDGRQFDLITAAPLTFDGDGAEALDPPFVYTEETFTQRPANEPLQATFDGDPLVRYGSCTYELLPPEAVEADLVDGTQLRFFERFEEAAVITDTAPAGFIRADVTIGGETVVVTDYWNLVYSAFRHNTSPSYWVLFDSPVTLEGVGEVHGVELITERPPDRPAQVSYFGADLTVLKTLNVEGSVRRIVGGEPPSTRPRFRRGDVGGDGRVQITDAIGILGHIFRRETISCRKAADANDDGRVNLVDVLDVLGLLFRNGDALPEPTVGCGEDPTEDGLTCETPEACR
jgi:hypothetical protein